MKQRKDDVIGMSSNCLSLLTQLHQKDWTSEAIIYNNKYSKFNLWIQFLLYDKYIIKFGLMIWFGMFVGRILGFSFIWVQLLLTRNPQHRDFQPVCHESAGVSWEIGECSFVNGNVSPQQAMWCASVGKNTKNTTDGVLLQFYQFVNVP